MDRVLLAAIALLAGALVWVVSGTLEQKVINVDDQAPPFSVTTDNGRTVSLSNFGGKLLVLNFWASWCEPCVVEVPSLDAFQRELAPQGVVVLGVSIDRNERLYRQFLGKAPVSFLTARDPDANISSSYGTFLFPDSYIIDPNGKVIEKIINAQNWLDPQFLDHIQKML